jgi:hypothetical protein
MGAPEDIGILEVKLAELKVEYEQYFARVLKREPIQHRESVERTIRQYSNIALNNTALKFKFNNLVGKYNSYKQYWTRILRKIEEGTYTRRAESVTGTRLEQASQPSTSSAPKKPATPRENGKNNDDSLKQVYNDYIKARKECNEPTDGLTFDKLKQGLSAQRSKNGGNDHDLTVYVQDGKAKISMTPKK